MKVHFDNNLNINKLSAKCNGPFKILKVNNNGVTYLLSDNNSGKTIRAHHKDLHLFKESPLYLKNHVWFRTIFAKVSSSDNNLMSHCDLPSKLSPIFQRMSVVSDAVSTSSSEDSDVSLTTDDEDREWSGRGEAESFVRSRALDGPKQCRMCKLELYLDEQCLANGQLQSIEPSAPESFNYDESAEESESYCSADDREPLFTFDNSSREFWQLSAASNSEAIAGADVTNNGATDDPAAPVSSFHWADPEIPRLENFIDSYSQRLKRINEITNVNSSGEFCHSTPLEVRENVYATRSKGSVPDQPEFSLKFSKESISTIL